MIGVSSYQFNICSRCVFILHDVLYVLGAHDNLFSVVVMLRLDSSSFVSNKLNISLR